MSAASVGSRRPETALLAAVHKWSVAGGPRLVRMLPSFARAGDPMLLEGAGFHGGELRAHFGAAVTWAVALSDREAITVVPAEAAAGPLSVSRHGLRSNALSYGGPPREGPSWVVRVDPRDGACGVFRNPVVLVHLSRPLDRTSFTATSFRVEDADGPVPGAIRWSPDRRVIVWIPHRLLAPRVEHRVIAEGLRDQDGGAVARHRSRFVPCALVRPGPG